MGFMADQAVRLERGDLTLKQLQSEIVAILRSDAPIEVTSPMRVGPTNDGTPPMTFIVNINTDGTTQAPFNIEIAGPAAPVIPPDPNSTPINPGTSTGGGGFSGVVVSGSGTSYNCTLTGPNGISFAAPVSMPMVDATATVSPGTYVPVFLIGATYIGFPTVFGKFTA